MSKNKLAKMSVAVIGAGAVGRMHIERCRQHDVVEVGAVVDCSDGARAIASQLGVPHFADHRAMLDAMKPDGVVIATPNSTHADIGIDCIDRGVPILVEKPVADTVENAQRLCDRAAAAGVPLLVGHQRRHNPILRTARDMIRGGLLGRPVTATVMALWLKPESYFELAWRRQPGGGPVLINLIHDIDMLRFVLGEIVTVQAITSNAVRGFEVEDTAVVNLRFASGALATLSVSDAVAAPWNWDLAAGEAAHYPQQDVNSHFICGTEASLTLPRLEVWRYDGTPRGWQEPLTQQRTALHRADPYMEQLRHFRAVVEGGERPLCSGPDGLRTLQATRAVQAAADTGLPVSLPH